MKGFDKRSPLERQGGLTARQFGYALAWSIRNPAETTDDGSRARETALRALTAVMTTAAAQDAIDGLDVDALAAAITEGLNAAPRLS